MPELPEVEVSRRGILPFLINQSPRRVLLRVSGLRHVFPTDLESKLVGRRLNNILRRGKYLLFDFGHDEGGGWLILHLGMTGSLRVIGRDVPPRKHDHVDFVFARHVLRFRDPRRFGTLLWHEGDIETHPSIAVMGLEPLESAFTGKWFHEHTRKRHAPVKSVIMDSHFVVGVGNIYASESLFLAGISPTCPVGRLSLKRCEALVQAIRQILEQAIACGGSSIRDYVHSDGGAGSFQLSCAGYGREGEPCVHCQRPVRRIVQAGRSTFYCPKCQH